MKEETKFKPLPVRELKKRIKQFDAIDWESADVDLIKTLLTPLFRGYALEAPILPVGQVLYRGVPWATKPTRQTQLIYPPAHLVTRHQRTNRPHHPLFYSSVSREPPFFELRPQAGDHIALSKWVVSKRMLVNRAGYSDSVFTALQSKRQPPLLAPRMDFAKLHTPENKLIGEFLAMEFARIISPSDESRYKLTVAIAEKLCGPLTDTAQNGHSTFPEFAGLMYPAISMAANSDNVALFPWASDQNLTFDSVEWYRVDALRDDFKVEVTKLDFADAVDADGNILWKGRLPHWVLASEEELKLSVENGRWVAHDKAGKIIDPT